MTSSNVTDRVLRPVDEVAQVVVVAVMHERLLLKDFHDSALHVWREDERQDTESQLDQQQSSEHVGKLYAFVTERMNHTFLQ